MGVIGFNTSVSTNVSDKLFPLPLAESLGVPTALTYIASHNADTILAAEVTQALLLLYLLAQAFGDYIPASRAQSVLTT